MCQGTFESVFAFFQLGPKKGISDGSHDSFSQVECTAMRKLRLSVSGQQIVATKMRSALIDAAQ